MPNGPEDRRVCIYCGQPFFLGDVCWYLNDNIFSFFAENHNLKPDGFKHAIDQFLVDDRQGREFYLAMGGTRPSTKSKDRRHIVRPSDFCEDGSKTGRPSRNLFHSKTGSTAPIFRQLAPEDAGYPGLRFTEEFISALEPPESSCLRDRKSRLEEYCMKAVCPRCSSFLPKEVLSTDKKTYVVRLGLFGSSDKEKATFNLENIWFNCLNRGGWTLNPSGMFASSHYMLERHYYQAMYEDKAIPDNPADGYAPPLLLRLDRNNIHILLVIMDIPVKQALALNAAVLQEKHTPQTSWYMDLLRHLDGCILLLSASSEILPRISHSDVPTEKILDPLGGMLSFLPDIPEYRHKPAALVLTNFEKLFPGGETITVTGYEGILDCLDSELWKELGTRDPSALSYEADCHECLQFSTKEFVKKLLPGFWSHLTQYLGRIDIFPVDLWTPEEPVEKTQRKINTGHRIPLSSSPPIFWLLDVVKLDESQPQ